MKLSVTRLTLASAALIMTTPVTTAGSSYACGGQSCSGSLSFFKETIVDVSAVAQCTNGQNPYISSYDFASTDDGFSFETTYRSSSGTLATAFDCTSTENFRRSRKVPVECGIGSTGGLQIKFTCNNLIDSCEISWAIGIVCPSPVSTGTSSATSTVAITATGQAAALVLPVLSAAAAMHV